MGPVWVGGPVLWQIHAGVRAGPDCQLFRLHTTESI